MSRWYRAYEGTVTDPKLGEAAMVAGCSKSIAIAAWHAILESAASTQDGGRFDTTPRRVAVTLGEGLPVIEALFSAFNELDMAKDGLVCNWMRRQFESDSSTERSRKLRERRKNVVSEDATLQGRCATPPDTEAETEKKETPSLRSGVDAAPAPAPKKSKRQVKTTFPKDLEYGPAHEQVARKWGVPDERMLPEFEKWKSHHIAKGSLMSDWPAAWDYWCSNVNNYSSSRGPRNEPDRQYRPAGPRESPFVAIIRDELAAEDRARRNGVPGRDADHGFDPSGFDFESRLDRGMPAGAQAKPGKGAGFDALDFVPLKGSR